MKMVKTGGFIGLGQMGRWMALNLVKCHFDLTVFDINEEAMALLTKHGAKQASSPAQLARCVDWIILSLPNSDIVEEVVFNQEGIVQGSRAGQILIDCGTADYLWTREFSASLQEHGIRFADAPISGMEKRAKEATLTIMYGGDEDQLKEVRPVLEAMGSTIIPMGGVGNGQLAKMINNVILNTNMATLAEVLPLAVKLGLDPEKTAQFINTGSGQSFASKAFIPNILENCFDKGYPLNQAYKDMVSVVKISASHHIPLPMVHTAATTYQMALTSDFAHEDKGAMIKVFERLMDVKFRKKETR